MHRQPVRLLLPRCINVLKHLTSINASACWHNCRYLLGKCEFPMILYPFSTILLVRKVACQREIPLISSVIAIPLVSSLSLTPFSLLPDPVLCSNIVSRSSFCTRDLRKISIDPFLFFFFSFIYLFFCIAATRGFERLKLLRLSRELNRGNIGTSLFVSDTSPDKREEGKRHNSARYQATW